MTYILSSTDKTFEQDFQNLLTAKRDNEADVADSVAGILDDVRRNGDAAVCSLTERFDRFDVKATGLRITGDEIENAVKAVDDDTLSALKVAAARIRAFHTKQLPKNLDYTDKAGVRLGQKWTAVDAVGLYVPGGTASYPSSVLMNAIPASVAGVERVVMVVPTPDNALNPLVLAAAHLGGVTEIYRIGGAQAVAALAYGTETIVPVDKIVGPGNAYVAEAKRQVFGKVGIDSIAGPSEILVVADNKNDPAWIAADLLSQAEHDTVAQSILITDDAAFGIKVQDAIKTHLQALPRADIAKASWDCYGAVITVASLDVAAALVNALAPEHLELAVADPDKLMHDVRHAGAIFLGRYTPEAIGDYVAGPNHVLPTSRGARFSSGLGVYDFMKRTSFVGCDAASLNIIGPAAVKLAETEGLNAHALSVAIRLADHKK